MTSGSGSIALNTSLQLTGLTTTMSTPTNQSDDSPTGAMNWSVPEGCTMVLFSQMDFSPWTYTGGLVSAEVRDAIQRIKICIEVSLFLIGGPANVINMAVFYRQGLKDRVMLCLFFLALTDVLYMTISIVLQGEELYYLLLSRQEIGPYLTFVINNNLFILFCLYYASPILSSIIAIERCLCVFNPLTFQNLLRTRTMAVIIFVVYVSVYALAFVVFLRYRIGCLFDPTTGIRILMPIPGEFYEANKEFTHVMDGIVLGVGIFGGTMVTVTIATVLTILKLRHIKEWRSEVSSSFSSGEVALTKMLVGGSILFIICLSPFALFNFVRLFFPQVAYGQRDHNLYLSGAWVADAFLWIKPSFNIFVYYAMGSRYRDTFWAIFGCRKGKQQTVFR